MTKLQSCILYDTSHENTLKMYTTLPVGVQTTIMRPELFTHLKSLIACVHGKVRSLSKNSVARAANYIAIVFITNSTKICMIRREILTWKLDVHMMLENTLYTC